MAEQIPNRYPFPPASHHPCLAAWAIRTRGPILELGCGYGSTALLHEIAAAQGRDLLTVETDVAWLRKFADLASQSHELRHVNTADILGTDWPAEREWGLVFVDHGIAAQRGASAMQFLDAPYPVVVLVHDCSRVHGTDHYHAEECLTAFPFVNDYRRYWPHTLVLANHRRDDA